MFCICGCDMENTCHFLLRCHNLFAERNTVLKKITNDDSNILNQVDTAVTKIILFGNWKYSNEVKLQILSIYFKISNRLFILTSKRFNKPLLNS